MDMLKGKGKMNQYRCKIYKMGPIKTGKTQSEVYSLALLC